MEYLITTGGRPPAGRDGAGRAVFGDRSLTWAPDGGLAAPDAGAVPGRLALVTQLGRLFQDEHPEVPVLLDAGRYLAVALPEGFTVPPDRDCSYAVGPLPEGTVVRTVGAGEARRAPVGWIQDLVTGVDQAAYAADVAALAALPTRHSTSQHFTVAAERARAALHALGYATATEPVALPDGGTTHNVVADRVGTGPEPRRLVLVTAHLDSINLAGGPAAPAPGGDDNASGAAGVLAIARALAGHCGRNDLRLILFGGEEQGLHGSRAHVAALSAADRARIEAVVNMDMIGHRNVPVPTVLLESKPFAQPLIDRLAEAAASYTGLTVQTSLNPFASDHVPFLDAGVPAVLTIEGSDSANEAIHTAADTVDRVDPAYAVEIVRMNVAAVAAALGTEEGATVTGPFEIDPTVLQPGLDLPVRLRPYSGRYHFNAGAGARDDADTEAALADPTQPVLTPLPPITDISPDVLVQLRRPRFTLHVDVDGTDPLGVVSGDVRTSGLLATPAAHFVGRVTSDTTTGLLRRDLVVGDFALEWGGITVDRLEITLSRTALLATPHAEATFVATATAFRFGPFGAPQASPWFRDVEIEVDVEDGAVAAEPYDTHLHPDRPADLPREDLTLEKAFARSGVRVTRSPMSNTIDTTAAGPNQRWNTQELHDALQAHWSAFANRPQWKMWVFCAERADSDTLGGIMFDGDINEPGGVDRQGTALFTTSPFFHTAAGDYPQANPPAAEAARRELFFDLIHETGHAFNLAHSFQKQAVLAEPGTGAWPAPSWMPVTTNAKSLSWMNYPDQASASGGLSAEWFYDRFRFRFDDGENLFLRHAPARFVQMGNEAWFHNHGRAGRGSVDRRLELAVRTTTGAVEFGETVFVELRLRNVSGEPVLALTDLDPAVGQVEITVTGPSGERRPFLPFYRECARPRREILAPGDTRYHAVNLTMGMFGFPFSEPGTYRIEACYVNADGSTAPVSMPLTVHPPRSDEQRRAAQTLFTAPVGRVLAVGGTRTIGEVLERLDAVTIELGPQHPVSLYLTAARAMPKAHPHKVLEADSAQVEVLDAEPDTVERELAPVVAQPKVAADALGHICFRRVVDTYTDAAVAAGERGKARTVQREMLALFEGRKVVPPVVETVRARLRELG